MPSQRGLKLLLSVLGFPAGTGTLAYTLSGHYKSLMNFEGNFFLVKATQELYDSGIPKVPKGVQQAVEWILQRKEIEDSEKRAQSRQRRSLRGQDQTQQVTETTTPEEKPEIFSGDEQEKKYWCRYFDYSGGKENVIMQYDPTCILYNVFDLPGVGASLQQASAGVTSTTSTVSQSSPHKQITIKLDDFQEKTKNLETKRLKNNSEYKRGGFYVLRLDKNKIPNVDSTFTIEITKPGDGKWRAEKVYQPKISAVRIQAKLTGDPLDSVKLTFSNPLPSMRLLLKKVESAGSTVDSSASSSPDDEEAASYYFKNGNNEDKLSVEHVWSFGAGAQAKGPQDTSGSQIQKFDLTTLDKELFKNLGSQQKPKEGASSEEKYYLFKNVSDFWHYKVGDTITLYKLPKSKFNNPKQATQLGNYQVVSGVLVNLSSTLLRCVSKEQYDQQEFKANLRTGSNSLVDIYTDKDGEYCRKDDPATVLILVGYNGDIYKSKNK